MDFDKPLPKVGGYVIYATLLDYIDTFVHQYTQQNKGQYPSLRMTTDMVLSLLADVKQVDLTAFEDCHTIGDAIDTLEDKLLERSKKSEDEMIDSRKVGLFLDEDNEYGDAYERRPYNYGIGKSSSTPEEPMKPFILTSKDDKDWLRKCGISPEEM
jgi:hypothetical protein